MDFSSINPYTSNRLNLAARKNDVKAVERLLQKLNPNCNDNRGWTCLHEAAASDSYQSLLLILKHSDTRPLAETHEGHTALYIACRYICSMQTIGALLDSDHDIVNYGSTEGVTPLHIVSAQGRDDILQLLIDHGAMLDVQDFDGDTPLHDAALNTQHEALSVLLHAGADAEIKNESNYTAFHLACYKGCFLSVKKIFPYITDINQVTVNGDSALILAIQGCNEEIVHYLLRNGADPHIKNIFGDLALTVALNMGYITIFNMLIRVTDADKIDQSIILNACKPHYFKFEILESLIRNCDIGPDFFDFYEEFHILLEQIGDYQPRYLTNAPLNSLLNISEYIYVQCPDKFREIFYLFLMRGLAVDALNRYECPPIVYIHYCMHSHCFKEVFEIFLEQQCNVDYCSTRELLNNDRYIPDVILASLTGNPKTAPIILPHSLYCEPEFLLKFAEDNGFLGRIPQKVQDQILKLIVGANSEVIELDKLPYTILPLQHLSRQKIRSNIRNKGRNLKTTKQFYEILNNIKLPQVLKNYVRYV